MNPMISKIDQKYGIDRRVHFALGAGGAEFAHLQFNSAKVVICLQGAHVTSYQPEPGEELLWMSRSAVFAPGKAIRGGIPVCWPWFGAHPESPDEPQHGVARLNAFDILETHADEAGTSITLGFAHTPASLELSVTVQLRDHLEMNAVTTNNGAADALVGTALHTYFAVTDVASAVVPEVRGLAYKDKTRDFARDLQHDDLEVTGEVDRVYLNPPDHVQLHDGRDERVIDIDCWGHSDLVVWNPGPDAAAAMADFDADRYRTMLCIEPANALDNRISLAPGASYKFGQRLKLR